ncbi:MAG: prolyl oligopeptidase family serine peptidase [Rudaea sp.]
METNRPSLLIILLPAFAILLASGCSSIPAASLSTPPSPSPVVPATEVESPSPTRSLPTVSPTATAPPSATPEEPVGWRDLVISDFAAFHSQAGEDANERLIFGGISVDKPSRDLAPALAALLGRWEGYDYSPPVKKDNKAVLVVQSISSSGGKAYLWAGSDLQFPFYVKEIRFRVVPGSNPSVEWEGDASGPPSVIPGSRATFTFSYDAAKQALVGSAKASSGRGVTGPFELVRGQAFHVFQDYARYFESRRIYPREYRNHELARYGAGYLLHLPSGYDANSDKGWPLLLFLCGSGERGSDFYRFAKNAPFLVARENLISGFVIVAPLLNLTSEFRSFPEVYLDGVMTEVLADYRVDNKKIYMTGLSMGGEATYRYALSRPELFAAIAPLAGFDARFSAMQRQQGFVPSTLPYERLKALPVWAVHGADDGIVPLAADQAVVDAIKRTGGNVRFSVLQNHDHDVWTDTYSDPAFYAWLLQHVKP